MTSALFVVTTEDVSDFDRTKKLLLGAFEQNLNHLYVTICDSNMSEVLLMNALRSIYDTSREIHGKEVSKVTVVLYEAVGTVKTVPWQRILATNTVSQSVIDSLPGQAGVVNVEAKEGQERISAFSTGYCANCFATCAVGGTFDHLHDGHRILLTMAAFLTSKTLIVGITGPELLKQKAYADYMQAFEVRRANVEQFLGLVKPALEVDVQEINDVCGPTAQIEDIQGLILSQESLKGGEFVNSTRAKKGWSALELVVIDVVGGHSVSFSDKLSSTDYRRMESERKDHS